MRRSRPPRPRAPPASRCTGRPSGRPPPRRARAPPASARPPAPRARRHPRTDPSPPRQRPRAPRAPRTSTLSSRFDEMDASLLFQDVLVPWDRVFRKKDPLLGNRMRAETGMLPHVFHQTSTRATVKAQLVLGVASLMSQYLGTNGISSVQ